MKNMCI